MWWPWSFLRKRSNSDDGDGDAEDFPDRYENHGMKVRGERAKQCHRHDSKSKMCLDDIDAQIQKLKTLKNKICSRNNRDKRKVCEDEG